MACSNDSFSAIGTGMFQYLIVCVLVMSNSAPLLVIEQFFRVGYTNYDILEKGVPMLS